MSHNETIYIMNSAGFSDLVPVTVGHEHCVPGHQFGPGIKNNYSFHYIVSGKGTLVHGGTLYSLRKGDCFFIRKGEKVLYQADTKEPWEYIYIGFVGQLAIDMQTPAPVFPYIRNTFTRLMDALSTNTEQKESLTASALFEIRAELLGCNNQTNDLVEPIRRYIYYNYQNHLSVERIAAMMGFDRHYLTMRFKKQTGKTIIGYITETRMNYARKFLQQGYTVSEVAVMTGYQDPFVFSKAFRKYNGISPSQFRALSVHRF